MCIREIKSPSGEVRFEAGLIYGDEQTFETRELAEATLAAQWAEKARAAHVLCYQLSALLHADYDAGDEPEHHAVLVATIDDLRDKVAGLARNHPLTLLAESVDELSGDFVLDGEACTSDPLTMADMLDARRRAVGKRVIEAPEVDRSWELVIGWLAEAGLSTQEIRTALESVQRVMGPEFRAAFERGEVTADSREVRTRIVRAARLSVAHHARLAVLCTPAPAAVSRKTVARPLANRVARRRRSRR